MKQLLKTAYRKVKVRRITDFFGFKVFVLQGIQYEININLKTFVVSDLSWRNCQSSQRLTQLPDVVSYKLPREIADSSESIELGIIIK